MGLIDRVLEFAPVKDAILRRIDEAVALTRDQDKGWVPLSMPWTGKDLLPTDYYDLHCLVYKAYLLNPIAQRYIKMQTDFVLGNGVNINAKDEKVQEVLDLFWKDSQNKMAERIYWITSELSLYGEQIILFFVGANGKVQIIQKDPLEVDTFATDPDNYEKEIAVIMKSVQGGKQKAYIHANYFQKDYPQSVITNREMSDKSSFGAYDVSDKAYFKHWKINATTSSLRGNSDLISIIKWLDIYDEGLLNRMRLNRYRSTFLYDVSIDGGIEQVNRRRQEILENPPKPGSVNVHTNKEVWEAKTPNFGSAEAEVDLKQVKMMIATGLGVPEHYLAEGGDVNRATAAEMGLPTLKAFIDRQRFVGLIVSDILSFVIDRAVETKALSSKVERTFTIDFPDIDTADNLKVAQSLNQIAQTITVLLDSGVIDDVVAQKIVFDFLGEEIPDEIKKNREPKIPPSDEEQADYKAVGTEKLKVIK